MHNFPNTKVLRTPFFAESRTFYDREAINRQSFIAAEKFFIKKNFVL